MTKQQLQDELRQAMLSRDTVKTSVLRMVLSALSYYEIQKGADERSEGARLQAGVTGEDRGGGAKYIATDEDILTVIQKEAKKQKDSIEQFTTAGRTELVEKEEKELAILSSYLPKQMNEEEIRKLVVDALSSTGAKTLADIGKVMGALMPATKGKADGSLVSKIVKEELEK